MEKEPDFRDGFMLGIAVARQMGFKDSLGKVFGQLRAIAHGEVVLGVPTEEEIQAMVKELGRPATAEEMEYFRSSPAEQEPRCTERARLILRLMGEAT
jgi:hypothetical protein